MAKLRNISDRAVWLHHPEGHPNALRVEPGQVVDVVTDAVKRGDAYVVGQDGDARAYPAATWELVDEPKTKTKKSEGEE